LLLCSLLLATGLSLPSCFGCSYPESSFPFDRTRDEFLAFVRFVQSEWSYEAHGPNDICQDPETSSAFQRGNCEDFAVIVAFFAQAHWQYDSFVTILGPTTTMKQPHIVAFVQVDDQRLSRSLTSARAPTPAAVCVGRNMSLLTSVSVQNGHGSRARYVYVARANGTI